MIESNFYPYRVQGVQLLPTADQGGIVPSFNFAFQGQATVEVRAGPAGVGLGAGDARLALLEAAHQPGQQRHGEHHDGHAGQETGREGEGCTEEAGSEEGGDPQGSGPAYRPARNRPARRPRRSD